MLTVFNEFEIDINNALNFIVNKHAESHPYKSWKYANSSYRSNMKRCCSLSVSTSILFFQFLADDTVIIFSTKEFHTRAITFFLIIQKRHQCSNYLDVPVTLISPILILIKLNLSLNELRICLIQPRFNSVEPIFKWIKDRVTCN